MKYLVLIEVNAVIMLIFAFLMLEKGLLRSLTLTWIVVLYNILLIVVKIFAAGGGNERQND